MQHTLLREDLYCLLSLTDLYVSLVFIASIIPPVSHCGCCLRSVSSERRLYGIRA